jgi:hypothetical protein
VASADPTVVVDDAHGAAAAIEGKGCMRTIVTVRPRPIAANVAVLKSCDFALLQGGSVDLDDTRVSSDIPESLPKCLSRVMDETFALVSDGQVDFARMAISPTERAILDAPARNHRWRAESRTFGRPADERVAWR